jgi:hypothetical protein
MLLCRLREDGAVNKGRPLMRFELLDDIRGIGGSIILGGREKSSDTGVRSLRPCVGGTGKETSASLEAVRRRRWLDMSLGNLLRDCETSMTPVSRTLSSSISLLVSLLATLTFISSS